MIHKFVVQFLIVFFLSTLFHGGLLIVSSGDVDWSDFGVVLNATVVFGGRVYSGMMVPLDVGGRMNISVGCNCLGYYLRLAVYDYNGSELYSLTVPAGSCLYVYRILKDGASVDSVVLEGSGTDVFHSHEMPSSGELKRATPTGTPPPGSETLKLLSYVAVAGIAAIVSSLATYLALAKRRS